MSRPPIKRETHEPQPLDTATLAEIAAEIQHETARRGHMALDLGAHLTTRSSSSSWPTSTRFSPGTVSRSLFY